MNLCPQGVTIIYLLADLKPVFLSTILKKLDHDDGVLTMVCNVMNAFSARPKSNFETPKLVKSLSGISKNKNGNILVKFKIHNDTTKNMLLDYNHRGDRYQDSKIDAIKEIAAQPKESIISSVVANVLE